MGQCRVSAAFPRGPARLGSCSGLSRSASLQAENHRDIILVNTAPLEMVSREPDGIMLSDGRDVIFQRDPFPELWARVARVDASAGGLTLSMRDDAPTPAPWVPAQAATPVIVVAQEASGTLLGDEDWNRYWVHMCGGYLTEALVNDRTIYCSGTTLGTSSAMDAYLRGLLEVASNCTDLNVEKGACAQARVCRRCHADIAMCILMLWSPDGHGQFVSDLL